MNNQQQLEFELQRFKAIIDFSDDAIISKTLNGIILSWNKGAERIFGYSAPEVIGKPMLLLIPTERQHEETEILSRISIGERVEHFETARQRKDGRLINISATISPIFDDSGKIIGASKIARDITERSKSEKMLEENEQRIQAIINNTVDAIVTINEEGNIESFNIAAINIFGYEKNEVIGKNIKMLMPEPFHSKHDNYLINYVTTGNKKIIGIGRELVGMKKDGTIFPMELSVSEVSLSDRRIFTGIIRDISEKKQAEQALLKAKTEAEEANRAKSDFLASMSHEIRTPMNAIIGMSELLIESDLTEEQLKYVKMLKDAGDNLLILINDILDLSKVEANLIVLEVIEFDLQSAMQKVCDLMSTKAMLKGLSIGCSRLEDISMYLKGDPNRLKQILINLIGNAIKFTEHGSIMIGVEKIGVTLNAQGAEILELRFFVKDTGIGIPPEKISVIFDKFTQADSSTARKYGGTGLGLAISKRLLELMGGRLWVESEVGKGSAFYFTVPFEVIKQAKQSSEKSVDVSLTETQGGVPKALNILVVDDSNDNRVLMLAYFTKTPHYVETAENGAIAVEKFKSSKYDLILMDVQMPIMDGYTATAEIRAIEAIKGLVKTPIVALTANAMKEDELQSIKSGCDGHLAKPIKKAVLMDAIAKYTKNI
jgi:two-component system sensor histidine kinase/response regulator